MEVSLDEFFKKNWRRYGLTVAFGTVALVEGAYICSLHDKNAGYLPPQANNPAISQKVSTKDSIPIVVNDDNRLTLPPTTTTSQDLVGTQVPSYSYSSFQGAYPAQQYTVETPLPVIPQAVEPPLPNQSLPINGNSEFINNTDIISESENNTQIVTEGKIYTDGRIAYIGGENLNFGNDISVDFTKKN